MDEYVVISGAGNGFRTREEAVAYAQQLLGHPAVQRDLYVMQLVEVVSRTEPPEAA